jgi:hypothetical protein
MAGTVETEESKIFAVLRKLFRGRPFNIQIIKPRLLLENSLLSVVCSYEEPSWEK